MYVPEVQPPTGTAGVQTIEPGAGLDQTPRPTEKAAMKTTGDIWALVADGFAAVWVGPVCPP